MQARGRADAPHRIAVIPGDGIGVETTAAAVEVLEAAAARWAFEVALEEFPWGCDFYAREGQMMPTDALNRLDDFEAILLGAIGHPDVPDNLSVWELIMPIRRNFGQYVNLRPVRHFPGVASPLAPERAEGVDFVVVRENTEGEYSDIGGLLPTDRGEEVCIQISSFSRSGVERAARYAFQLATQRRSKLVSATKSNGLPHVMPFWDSIVKAVATEYSTVAWRDMHVDALAANFTLSPAELDVVLASNLFGDILSELGAALVGGIGLGPSANIDPSRAHPSMFEPIHGSAPDIAGHGVANPIGQVWSVAMMLRHLGQSEAATAIMGAIASVLAAGEPCTPDLGGSDGTAEVTGAIIAALDAGVPASTSPSEMVSA